MCGKYTEGAQKVCRKCIDGVQKVMGTKKSGFYGN